MENNVHEQEHVIIGNTTVKRMVLVGVLFLAEDMLRWFTEHQLHPSQYRGESVELSFIGVDEVLEITIGHLDERVHFLSNNVDVSLQSISRKERRSRSTGGSTGGS